MSVFPRVVPCNVQMFSPSQRVKMVSVHAGKLFAVFDVCGGAHREQSQDGWIRCMDHWGTHGLVGGFTSEIS